MEPATEATQQLELWEVLIIENFYLLIGLAVAVLIVIAVYVFRGGKIKIGENEFMIGGKKVKLSDYTLAIEMRNQMKRDLVSDIVDHQKETVDDFQIEFEKILDCCGDLHDTLKELIWYAWMRMFDKIADRNRIKEKFDGDHVRPGYRESRMRSFKRYYGRMVNNGWAALAPWEQMEPEFIALFDTTLKEMLLITTDAKYNARRETIKDFDTIIELTKGGADDKGD
jgi:hypothetical protein